MKRAYFAIALLAASCLSAVGFFHHPDWRLSAAMIAAAVLFLLNIYQYNIPRSQGVAATIFCIIAAALLPWPYRTIPLLAACGLALQILPIPVRWPRILGSAAISAAAILLIQSIALCAYTQLTARQHDLPTPLAAAIVKIDQFVGISATLSDQTIHLTTAHLNIPLAATWDLLIDPATACFFAAAFVWLLIRQPRHLLAILACLILWIPARIVLLSGLLAHRAMLDHSLSPLLLMNQFWSSGLTLALLAVPATLALLLTPPLAPMPASPQYNRSAWLTAILACVAGGAIAMCLYWDPAGQREKGRVVIDESHSTWSPQYVAAIKHLSRYFDVSELPTSINDASLHACDVLIVKSPITPFDTAEVSAVKKFVARGGGLLLLADRNPQSLNELASSYGFTFQPGQFIAIDDSLPQNIRTGLLPHPILQNVPETELTASCWIEPDFNFDRGLILSTGLRSADPTDPRFGTFISLWTTRHLNGRVTAFAAAEQFSNAHLSDPGRAELLTNLVEWLNHRTLQDDPRPPLAGIAALTLFAALALTRGKSSTLILSTTAALMSFSVAIPVLSNLQHQAMPSPIAIHSPPPPATTPNNVQPTLTLNQGKRD